MRRLLAIACLLLAIELCYRASSYLLGLVPVGLSDLASVMLPFAAAVLPLLALERVAPSGAEQESNYLRGALYSLVTAASVFLWAKVAAHITTVYEYPLFKWRLFKDASDATIIAAILLNVWLVDFFGYWFHRASHTYAWLWKIHAPHHAAQHFNCLADYSHVLWQPARLILATIPFALFFGIENTRDVVFLTSLVVSWDYFIHADTWVNFGPLGIVFCDNAHHKMHHSRDHHNVNFAVRFPVWDVLFGTYCKPGPVAQVGVEGMAQPRLYDLLSLTAGSRSSQQPAIRLCIRHD